MTIVELFGGIGAIRKASINTKLDFKIIDYVENDKNAVKIYNALYNENYNAKDVRDYHLPTNIKVDILMHGSPCQDFSVAGFQKGGEKGSGTRSSLLYETLRIINEAKHKPKWIIWENVPSVLHKKHFKVFNDYIQKLNRLGYTSKYQVLNAMNFGIPQRRERIFCISYLGNSNPFEFNNLNNIKMENIQKYLEKDVENKYIVKQKYYLNKIINNDYRIRYVNDYVYTITIKQMRIPNSGLIKLNDGKYRYLTEKECWKLMGFTYEDFKKALNVVTIKNGCLSSILYKAAGNSIVVPILESILKEIYIKEIKI